MNAIDYPVRAARREQHTGDMQLGQRSPIIMPEEGLPNREEIATAPALDVTPTYMQQLEFNEEPVTIRIEPFTGKNAATVVDNLRVNGKGAEMLIGGKWREVGHLPTGMVLTTKRKYVEVLARCNADNVEHEGVKVDQNRESNDIYITTSKKANFSVIRDANPAGADWLTRILMER